MPSEQTAAITSSQIQLPCSFPIAKFAATFSYFDCGSQRNKKELNVSLVKDTGIKSVVMDAQSVTASTQTIGVAKQMVDMTTQTTFNLERKNLIYIGTNIDTFQDEWEWQ